MIVEDFKNQDISQLLEIRSAIADVIENKAFFNWSEVGFKDELKHSKVWVVKDCQGFMYSFLLFREISDQLEIMVLGSRPNERQKGAMQLLIHKLQTYAALCGAPIHLEVHEQNQPARRLYKKTGFKLLHLRKNYYADGAGAEMYLWKNPSAGE